MRFEVAAAYCLGVVLPVLEVCRRGRNFHPVTSYVDDFLAGGLLLWAAHSVTKRRPFGPALLVAAWGVLAGGFYYSFFGQWESNLTNDVSGLPNQMVIIIKGVLYAIVIVCLVCSVRNVARRENEKAHLP